MCVIVFIAAMVVVNANLARNAFLKDYEIKIEALTNEVSALKDNNKQLSIRLDQAYIANRELTQKLKNANDDSTDDAKVMSYESSEANVPVASVKTSTVTAATSNKNPVASPKPVVTPQPTKPVATPEPTVAPVEKAVVSNTKINTTDITTKSNLTADQFNAIIESVLTKFGHSYTKSKLNNIGESLCAMEQATNVNGLFALAVGSLESGYGTSAMAKNKNNLFGIYKGNGYGTFSSVDECIQYWGGVIRTGYMDKGATTISSISNRYCARPTTWTRDVSWIFGAYAKAAAAL